MQPDGTTWDPRSGRTVYWKQSFLWSDCFCTSRRNGSNIPTASALLWRNRTELRRICNRRLLDNFQVVPEKHIEEEE